MQNFTIYYKDYLGRNNKINTTEKTQLEAENKFKILYANCTITNIIIN